MKFLIPNYCVPDSFVDNVSFTLRAMGHEVITLKAVNNSFFSSPYVRVLKQVSARITGSVLTAQEKWLRSNFKQIKPEVVLTLTQSLNEETLHLLRKAGIRTVAWWGDTAANMKSQGLLADGWDLIFIKDAYAASKLKAVGLPAYQLLEAMNPAWHKPLGVQKNNSLVIAGSFYEYRHYLVRKLLNDGVAMELYGGRMPLWADNRLKKMHTGQFIIKEEKSRIFGESGAVLNSTAMSEFDSVNCRAFEVAGAGALQIMEYRSAIEECFVPGKELLVYKTYEELNDLVKRIESAPEEMKKIRAAGLKRALAEHTYKHRLEYILKMLEGKK